MTDEGGWMPHVDGEYVPNVPNHAKRGKERKGKPRAAQHDDISASLDRIFEDIFARDGRNLREMRYRGRRR